jgi:hypothetical protein
VPTGVIQAEDERTLAACLSLVTACSVVSFTRSLYGVTSPAVRQRLTLTDLPHFATSPADRVRTLRDSPADRVRTLCDSRAGSGSLPPNAPRTAMGVQGRAALEIWLLGGEGGGAFGGMGWHGG